MFKKLALVLGMMLIVLAVACGSDKESSKSDKTQNDTTPVATKSAATKAAPTTEATEEVGATKEPDGGDSAGALESLSFLTGGMFGGEAQSGAPEAADPELANMLVASTDLPSAFASVGGDTGFSMTLPQGEAKMAMRTFSEGDPNMSEMTPTIVSAAMAMPPAALEEFDSQLAQLDEMTTDDIQNAMGGGASMMGIEFKELSIDKISLGDGGINMHMVMDMSGLVEGLGDLAQQGTEGFPTSLTFDMYVFKKGDVVLMAMTMLPAEQGSSISVESLAKIMESRAP